MGFGVGKARIKDKTSYYVVAYFFPRGNLPGEFDRNVLPKGSVSRNAAVVEQGGRKTCEEECR